MVICNGQTSEGNRLSLDINLKNYGINNNEDVEVIVVKKDKRINASQEKYYWSLLYEIRDYVNSSYGHFYSVMQIHLLNMKFLQEEFKLGDFLYYKKVLHKGKESYLCTYKDIQDTKAENLKTIF